MIQLISHDMGSNLQSDFNALLGFSTIESLARFQNTSLSATVRVREEVVERVTQLLAPYFDEPLIFLKELSHPRLNSVLSGQFVASLLDSTNSEQYTYLDIISGRHTFSDTLAYLLKEEGATIKGVLAQVPGMRSEAFASAIEIELKKSSVGRVRLIQSVRSSPLFPVTLYYSTHLMNAIADNVLVVGYPKLTFLNRGLLTENEYPADPEATSFAILDSQEVLGPAVPGRVAVPSAVTSNLDQWRTFADSECVHIRLNEAAVDMGALKLVRWKVHG